ncbi:hypothetical protein ACFP1I_14985 [Dyadobacter subterraneus]|uniref:Uncharacterized protein n=1 Tax=Dyadobacter subterraneus TaxID=2773304 RepID=A0ABR9WBR8_9BACT|nr:hypothetical protein [Dyadobacter subterraneus]MBE9462930.1 hypothetical protein [Dyadobacter subterraneus]
MKIFTRLFLFLIIIISCKSDFVIPVFWTQNGTCATFEIKGEEMIHRGRCCEYVNIPKFKLTKNTSFSVAGSYTYYTQSGKAETNLPITVNGKLSKDGQELTINYTALADSSPVNYTFHHEEHPAVCDCNCYFK